MNHRKICSEMAQGDKIESVVDSLKDKKKIEWSMIMSSYTISNPEAMMIVSFNTNLTFLAMPCSVVTNYFANIAILLLRFCFPSQKSAFSCFVTLPFAYLLIYIQLRQNWSHVYFITLPVNLYRIVVGNKRTKNQSKSIENRSIC